MTAKKKKSVSALQSAVNQALMIILSLTALLKMILHYYISLENFVAAERVRYFMSAS